MGSFPGAPRTVAQRPLAKALELSNTTGFNMKWTTSVLATAALAVFPSVATLHADPPVGPAAVAPGISPGYFSIELGSGNPSPIKSFSGGGATAQIQQMADGKNPNGKTVIDTRYDEIRFQIATGMSKPMSQWITATFNGLPGRADGRDGGFVVADHNYKARRRVDFTEALITEIKFPALDAANGKEIGYLDVTVSPGTVKLGGGNGSTVSTPRKSKNWLTSNFKVTLGKLPCDRILKVDPIVVTQNLVEEEHGHGRYDVVPQRIEYSNIVLTISEADREKWEQWYKEFLIDGKNSNSDELQGTIEGLDATMKTVLLTIDLEHVGLKRFNPYPARVNTSEAASYFTVELYVEQMKLTIKDL